MLQLLWCSLLDRVSFPVRHLAALFGPETFVLALDSLKQL